jgi:hypothetical protein
MWIITIPPYILLLMLLPSSYRMSSISFHYKNYILLLLTKDSHESHIILCFSMFFEVSKRGGGEIYLTRFEYLFF